MLQSLLKQVLFWTLIHTYGWHRYPTFLGTCQRGPQHSVLTDG